MPRCRTIQFMEVDLASVLHMNLCDGVFCAFGGIKSPKQMERYSFLRGIIRDYGKGNAGGDKVVFCYPCKEPCH